MICKSSLSILKSLVLMLALTLAVPTFAAEKADDDCENLLTGQSDAVEAELNEYLRNNQAPSLDHRRLSAELRKMSQDLVPIRNRATQIMRNEIDYAYGRISRQEAVARSQAERRSLSQMAEHLLAKENLTLSEHRQLEGLRVLLDRTKRVEQMSQQQIKEQMQAEQEAADDKTEATESDDSTEESIQEPNDSSVKESPKGDEPLSPQKKKKNQPPKPKPTPQDQAKEALNKHRERRLQEPKPEDSSAKPDPKKKDQKSDDDSGDDESSTDDKSKSEDSKENEDKASESEEKSKPVEKKKPDEKLKKPADKKPSPENGKPEQGENEKSDEAGQNSDDSSDEAGDKADEQGDGESDSGDADEGKPSESKPGEGKPGEGKPQKGEAKPGQGDGQSESEPADSSEDASGEAGGEGEGKSTAGDPKGNKKQSGKSNSKEHLGDTAVEGNDGLEEGGAEADQSLLDNFNSFFKDKLKELREILDSQKPEDTKDNPEKEAPGEAKGETRKPTERSQPKKSDTSAKPEAAKPYVPQPLGARRAPMTDKKGISDTQISNLLHRLIRRLTASSLRNYANSDAHSTSLGHLQTTLVSMTSEGSDDAVRQSAQEVKDIRETLAAFQVNYKDLEALGLSLLKTFDGGGHDSLRKIHFINEALTYLSKYSTLTDEEQRVLDLSRRIIGLAGSGSAPTDKDFCMAFVNQLIGPLSKRVILEKYKVESSRDGFDFGSMAKAIRKGEFNDLLIHSALAPYMNMLLNTSLKPKGRKVPTDARVTINERDPDLELAQELDSFQRFYRDGSPTEIDLLRFISGDMLEEVYHDETIKNDPQTLHPKKVSFVLYDVSGSMGSGNKQVLRNALILAYLDRSQREVQSGKAEHIVYLMAFDGNPHEPERIQGMGQAQAAFERIRNHPMGSGGDDSITGGLVDVYRRIAERQNEGGELNRANILLITDAVAPVDFNRIEDARKEIGPEVDVRLNAISMGDLNKDVQKLVQMSGGEGEGRLGLVSHQHIGYEEITRILDATTKLSVIDKTMSAFDSKAQNGVENSTVIDLKNKLVMLGARRSTGDNAKLSSLGPLERMVASEGAEAEHEHLTRGFKVFQRLALSNASAGWTRAEKLEQLWAFVEDIGREMGSTGEEVMSTLSERQKQSLRHWLN